MPHSTHELFIQKDQFASLCASPLTFQKSCTGTPVTNGFDSLLAPSSRMAVKRPVLRHASRKICTRLAIAGRTSHSIIAISISSCAASNSRSTVRGARFKPSRCFRSFSSRSIVSLIVFSKGITRRSKRTAYRPPFSSALDTCSTLEYLEAEMRSKHVFFCAGSRFVSTFKLRNFVVIHHRGVPAARFRLSCSSCSLCPPRQLLKPPVTRFR